MAKINVTIKEVETLTAYNVAILYFNGCNWAKKNNTIYALTLSAAAKEYEDLGFEVVSVTKATK